MTLDHTGFAALPDRVTRHPADPELQALLARAEAANRALEPPDPLPATTTRSVGASLVVGDELDLWGRLAAHAPRLKFPAPT
ncbi:MAG: hypothetical protein KA711_03105 [Ideonella sp. WA131b]|nr:hypothetical protein [Ideonella sp. WA131b]